MIVNISRNKLLINAPMLGARKPTKTSQRCNHCGGLLRFGGDSMTCIMCSRDSTHVCNSCLYASSSALLEKNKKSA